MRLVRLLVLAFVLIAALLSTQAAGFAPDERVALPGDPELDVFFTSEYTDDIKTCRTSFLEPDEVEFCRMVLDYSG